MSKREQIRAEARQLAAEVRRDRAGSQDLMIRLATMTPAGVRLVDQVLPENWPWVRAFFAVESEDGRYWADAASALAEQSTDAEMCTTWRLVADYCREVRG